MNLIWNKLSRSWVDFAASLDVDVQLVLMIWTTTEVSNSATNMAIIFGEQQTYLSRFLGNSTKTSCDLVI